MSELAYLSITQAIQQMQSGHLTAEQLVEYHVQRLDQLDNKFKFSLFRCNDEAIKQARTIDAQRKRGEQLGPLAGIPYTVKDMFLVRGTPTTAGSHILENFISPYDATVITKLKNAGAVLIAKVNQDEFGHGSSTENSAYHPTHNPWDFERVPGGSSGGGAAVVAAGVGLFSLGTDTGGSIRQPAAFCGVVGMRPTYGLVSRSGVVAMASSLDTIGPITRNAEDAALILDVLAGKDPLDATTIERSGVIATGQQAVKKIGVISNYTKDLTSPMRKIYDQVVVDLQLAGIEVIEKTLRNLDYSLPTYYIVVPSEISSNLSRYDGVRYGYSDKRATNLAETYLFSRGNAFGPEVKRRILTGTYTLSAGYYDAYYKKAMQLRSLIIDDFNDALSDVDVLIGPTTPAPAWRFGENSQDPIQMYLADVMTVGASLAGLPSLSVPSGIVESMPVGLQIIGRQNDDARVLGAGQEYQAVTSWHSRRPVL